MPTYKPSRSKGFKLLSDGGFTDNEAAELSSQYNVAQMRSIPYLVRMRRWRRLYATNLAGKGYDWNTIRQYISDLYGQKGWRTPDGQPDVWRMLKDFRQASIERNEYIPSKRSHHGRREIEAKDLRAQQKQLEIQRQIMRETGWQ